MPISGWARPLHYGSPDSEVLTVRNAVGLFDLHPMSRQVIEGADALAFMQLLVTSDVHRSLSNYVAQYTCFCDEQGGIIDDVLIFPKSAEEFLITSSVAAAETLSTWLKRWVQDEGLNVQLRDVSASETQFALQGPRSLELIRKEMGLDEAGLKHMHFMETSLLGVPVFLARTGYTGEVGFEIFTNAQHGVDLWRHLTESGAEFGIQPFGIMAAQTLRLEKGYVMHGLDMSSQNNPYEIGLGWTVCTGKGKFLGRSALSRVKTKGVERRLCRYYLEGPETMPSGTKIYVHDREVGRVTSCCKSPTLGRVIGMGMIDASVNDDCSCFVRRGDLQWPLSFVERAFYDPEGSRLRMRLAEDC
ncbi:aminomethyltransferase family protein [Marinobacter sp. LM1]|jgi:glycine cleavage system T protein|uniref:aminomethyltransferase family protein n=1 Tax=Marinobacter sp. LM1 TaxID=3003349 RepID=UPI0036D26AF2|tara:strand:- start:3903 stop:4979 length:1077 start_codon:yes stop_codon:yes gene_type:complete